ncbi:MAG: HEPN domain-containing protein [Sulfuricurvum sp.]
METAKIHFEQNIVRVKNLGKLHQAIADKSINELDSSDILRAQYVMLVSALDHFIHEIVRIGILEIYNTKRKPTEEFKKFIFATDENVLLKKAILEDKNNTWLDHQVRHRNGFKSFQQADKIEEAILLIDRRNLWSELTLLLKEDKEDLKKQLNLIVERRNQIAHEADIEPTYKELREIKTEDVEDSIAFIEKIVNSITQIVLLEES